MFKMLMAAFLCVVSAPSLAQNQLIGGVIRDPARYGAVRVITPVGMCTATAIGPRALITAQHCARPGDVARIDLAGTRGYCTMSVSNLPGHDVALCLADHDLTYVRHQSILLDRVEGQILLSGFGCTVPGGGQPDGFFRAGWATVGLQPENYDGWNYLIRGGAAVCFGDSGGAGFKVLPDGSLRLAGINSRGDIRSVSLLIPTFLYQTVSLMDQWVAVNKVDICGLTVLCPGV